MSKTLGPRTDVFFFSFSPNITLPKEVLLQYCVQEPWQPFQSQRHRSALGSGSKKWPCLMEAMDPERTMILRQDGANEEGRWMQ